MLTINAAFNNAIKGTGTNKELRREALERITNYNEELARFREESKATAQKVLIELGLVKQVEEEEVIPEIPYFLNNRRRRRA